MTVDPAVSGRSPTVAMLPSSSSQVRGDHEQRQDHEDQLDDTPGRRRRRLLAGGEVGDHLAALPGHRGDAGRIGQHDPADRARGRHAPAVGVQQPGSHPDHGRDGEDQGSRDEGDLREQPRRGPRAGAQPRRPWVLHVRAGRRRDQPGEEREDDQHRQPLHSGRPRVRVRGRTLPRAAGRHRRRPQRHDRHVPVEQPRGDAGEDRGGEQQHQAEQEVAGDQRERHQDLDRVRRGIAGVPADVVLLRRAGVERGRGGPDDLLVGELRAGRGEGLLERPGGVAAARHGDQVLRLGHDLGAELRGLQGAHGHARRPDAAPRQADAGGPVGARRRGGSRTRAPSSPATSGPARLPRRPVRRPRAGRDRRAAPAAPRAGRRPRR